MGHTIIEKILARAAGATAVQPGDIIEARVDLALANDVTAPIGHRRVREGGLRPRSSTPRRSPSCPTTSRPTRTSRRPRRPSIMREFATRARHQELLGGRPRRHRARAAARAGPRGAGRRHHRRRLAHLHLRRPRPPSRPASARPTSRPPWPGAASGCACPRRIRFVYHGRPLALRGRQGPHAAHDRPDRRRRRSLPGDGVHRPGDQAHEHRRPLHHVQHGHRGRRQERHRRLRRDHRRLPARAAPPAAAGATAASN